MKNYTNWIDISVIFLITVISQTHAALNDQFSMKSYFGNQRFSLPALKFVADYYNKKYECFITITTQPIDLFLNDIKTVQKDYFSDINKAANDEVRQGLIIGANQKHAAPCLFIIFEKNQYLVLLDSIGTAEERLVHLSKFPGTVLYLSGHSQTDDVSCFLHSMVILRDATRKINNAYAISNLISYLLRNSNPTAFENLFDIKKLPPALLKGPQNPYFFQDKFDEKEPSLIWSGKKQIELEKFRNQYTEIKEGKKYPPKKRTVYFEKKARRMIQLVALEWYLKNLQSEFYPQAQLDDFIKNKPSLDDQRIEFYLDQLYQYYKEFLQKS